MRTPLLIAIGCLLSFAAFAEETAADFEAQGIAALKRSQAEPDAIIAAAISFGKASVAYQDAKDEAKSTEMNSFLYWCKKKMTLKQMNAFLEIGDAAAGGIAKHMKEMESAVLPAEDATSYFERAEAYASAHPDEHLLIAARYFEVADRFLGTDVSVKAQRKSLDEIQLVAQAVVPQVSREEPIAPAARGRSAVPNAEKLKRAEQSIREFNKDEFARLTPETGKALAQKLLQQAAEAKDDAAAQFALLKNAASAAALSGDFDIAFGAIDTLAAAFEIDRHDLKAEALARVNNAAATPDAAKALVILALAASDDATAADNYPAAVKLLASGEIGARKTQNAMLAACVQSRSKNARTLQAEFAKANAARQTLKSKPDDPDANSVVGRFLCFGKGEWKSGLPFLAKGNDAKLKALAVRENSTESSTEFMAMGTAWHDLAEKERSGIVKTALLERENYWCALALPKLDGMQRLKIKKRLDELAPQIRSPDSQAVGCVGKLYVSCGDKVDVSFNNKVVGQSSQWGDLTPIPLALVNGDTIYFNAHGESKHTYGVSWAFISNDNKHYAVSDRRNTLGISGALAKDSKFAEAVIGEFWVRSSLKNRMDSVLVARIEEPQAICVRPESGKIQKSATYRWVFEAGALLTLTGNSAK